VQKARRQYPTRSGALLVLPVLLLALPCLVLPAPGVAQRTKRVAVLELSGVLERPVLMTLTDRLRHGALAALKGTSYEVMTRENMAVLARNMDIDLAACEDGAECEVDIGRNVGADLVMSGGPGGYGIVTRFLLGKDLAGWGRGWGTATPNLAGNTTRRSHSCLCLDPWSY